MGGAVQAGTTAARNTASVRCSAHDAISGTARER